MTLWYTNTKKNTLTVFKTNNYRSFLRKDLKINKNELDLIVEKIEKDGMYFGAFFNIIKRDNILNQKIKKKVRTRYSYWLIKNNETNKSVKICNLNQFFNLINLDHFTQLRTRNAIYRNNNTTTIKHFTITRVLGDDKNIMRVL